MPKIVRRTRPMEGGGEIPKSLTFRLAGHFRSGLANILEKNGPTGSLSAFNLPSKEICMVGWWADSTACRGLLAR